jgi:ribose transport system permease protein
VKKPQFMTNTSFMKNLGIFPILVLILILFSFLNPYFMTNHNMTNVLRQASINIVLAAGMTMVILTGGIDLSVGSILASGAVISVSVSLMPSLAPLAVPIGLLFGLLIGLVNGALISFVGLPPFIVTLGSMTAFRGAAYLLANGTTVINNDLGFAWIGNEYIGPLPWLSAIALIVILAIWFLLKRTVTGVRIYAVGGNEEAAKLTGIKTWKIHLIVYGLSGLLSGLAGVMLASRLYSGNGLLGQGYELDAIAAVILGGTSMTGGIGGIFGTLVGALIIAVLNNGLTIMNISYFWQLVIRGIVIIIAVVIDKFRVSKMRS